MKIVKDGALTIPLYHGTTGLFINSIEQHGLGSLDPLIALEAKDFMRDLFQFAEENCEHDQAWLNIRQRITPFVRQTKVEGLANFRHGGTYLAAFPEVATKYATENPSGSEYLTYLHILVRYLAAKGIRGFSDRFLGRPALEIWRERHDPYLITLENVNLNDLETETGHTLFDHIIEIEKLMSDGMCGPHAFKLKRAIPAERLSIAKLGSYEQRTGDSFVDTSAERPTHSCARLTYGEPVN